MVIKKKTAILWEEKLVPLDRLKPYERNPRKISKAAYNHLKESLKALGYHQRIAATPDLRVVGGHQRLKALRELGYKDIPVLQANRQLTQEEYKRAVMSDNFSYGEFDTQIVMEDFTEEDLRAWGADDALLKSFRHDKVGKTDPDDTPAIASIAVTAPGDTWLMGKHRLYCGDSTKPEDVKALLAGAKPHLMVTDPPYGVNYDPDWRERTGLNKKMTRGKVLNDHTSDWGKAWALFTGSIAYIWHADRFSPEIAHSLQSQGFKLRNLIVWGKSQMVISRGDYHHQHEPCWYAVRGSGKWCGDRKQTTLWDIPKPQKQDTGHSTQKPVECMRRPIENNSVRGDSIYEPFSGSGTTIIAGEMTGRSVYAMELNPLYVDMAIKRWEAFTGKKAVLQPKAAKTPAKRHKKK